MESNSKRHLLNAEEAATYLGVTKSTLYAYVSQKRFPHYKSTKKIYFDPADLDDFMERQLIYVTNHKEQRRKEK